MRLRYLNVYVSDVDAARSFFETFFGMSCAYPLASARSIESVIQAQHSLDIFRKRSHPVSGARLYASLRRLLTAQCRSAAEASVFRES